MDDQWTLVPGLLWVREMVRREYGAATWAAVVRASSPGADEEATCGDLPSEALIAWLGRRAAGAAGRGGRHPARFGRHEDLRSFVVGLAERARGGPPADGSGREPRLTARTAVDGSLLLCVGGPTELCALLEGVILGASERYAEPALPRRLKCRRRGDNRCVMAVSFRGERTEDRSGAARPQHLLRTAG